MIEVGMLAGRIAVVAGGALGIGCNRWGCNFQRCIRAMKEINRGATFSGISV